MRRTCSSETATVVAIPLAAATAQHEAPCSVRAVVPLATTGPIKYGTPTRGFHTGSRRLVLLVVFAVCPVAAQAPSRLSSRITPVVNVPALVCWHGCAACCGCVRARACRQIEVERDIKVSLMHHMTVLRSIVVVLGKIKCAVHVDFWIDVQASDVCVCVFACTP